MFNTHRHTLSQWLKLILKKLRGSTGVRKKVWPTTEEILAMPPFEELEPKNIVVVESAQGALRALEELSRETVVGFDTESKPTFRKGEKSTGPHIAQFATGKRTYVFLLHEEEGQRAVKKLVSNPALKKVGFGLHDDVLRVQTKLNAHPKSVVDLETLFTKGGYGRGVGVKVGAALVLKRRFRKSKKISTSNWAQRRLTPAQITYAANDAYAALRIFQKLKA